MAENRWPHIDEPKLRELWEQFAPSFLVLDDVEAGLPRIRIPFLTWLEGKGLLPMADVSRHPRRRVRLTEVTFTRLPDAAETQITVVLDQRDARVSRRGRAVGDDLIRAPAEATIEAVQRLLPIIEFQVEEAYALERPQHEPLAVVIARNGVAPSERYVGAVTITASAPEAAAKAALSAVNRKAEIATSLQPTQG
jgi:hypothetical protein